MLSDTSVSAPGSSSQQCARWVLDAVAPKKTPVGKSTGVLPLIDAAIGYRSVCVSLVHVIFPEKLPRLTRYLADRAFNDYSGRKHSELRDRAKIIRIFRDDRDFESFRVRISKLTSDGVIIQVDLGIDTVHTQEIRDLHNTRDRRAIATDY